MLSLPPIRFASSAEKADAFTHKGQQFFSKIFGFISDRCRRGFVQDMGNRIRRPLACGLGVTRLGRRLSGEAPNSRYRASRTTKPPSCSAVPVQ